MVRSLLVLVCLLLLMAMVMIMKGVVLLRLCLRVCRVCCRSLSRTRSFAGVDDVFDARMDGYDNGGGGSQRVREECTKAERSRVRRTLTQRVALLHARIYP